MKREIKKINEKIQVYELMIEGLTADTEEALKERITELKAIIKGLYVALLIVDKKFKKRCKCAKKILSYDDESELIEMILAIEEFANSELMVDEISGTLIDHIDGVQVVEAHEYSFTVSSFFELID